MSVSSRFGLGYRRDPHNVRAAYRPHASLDVSPLLPSPSLLPWWLGQGRIWQADVGACVAATWTWQYHAYHACRGNPQPLASVIGMYSLARCQEDSGRDPDTLGPLDDVGSYPANIMIAARDVGIISEAQWPSPASPTFDRTSVCRRPRPDDCVDAYDRRGLKWIAVEKGSTWQETRDTVRGLLQAGYPVGFAMFVDTAFMRNQGGIVTRTNERDPDGGGHAMAIVDATRDTDAQIGNWWRRDEVGAEWGLPNGTGRISWQLLHDVGGDMLALSAAPEMDGAT